MKARRIIVAVAAGFSLLLFVITAVAWARSYVLEEEFFYINYQWRENSADSRALTILPEQGTIQVRYVRMAATSPTGMDAAHAYFKVRGLNYHRWSTPPSGKVYFPKTFYVESEREPDYGPFQKYGWTVAAPAWAFMLVFALLPAAWAVKRHRRAHFPGSGFDVSPMAL